MHTKSIHFAMAVLVGLFFTQGAASAAGNDGFSSAPPSIPSKGPSQELLQEKQPKELSQELWIGGHGYSVKLTQSQINGVAGAGAGTGTHYKGHFPEDPDSWVRVSRLDGGWEGLAFVFNRLHTIRSGGSDDRVASFSFSHEEAPQCGADHMHADTSITPDSLASSAMAQAVTASYDTLCSDSVDGACLMLELELAFDQSFQDQFTDYESRAGAIINMVEGFYEAQFGIVFDTLSLTYPGSGQFTGSTNAEDLLEDITTKRANGQIAFLESDRSIFHFVTGRNFDGGTAGLAWLNSLCDGRGYATGISQAYSSNSITAVVVAHEIGHNLGARHDVSSTNGCPANTFIMSPSVSGSVSEFSSCSDTAITDQISALSSVEQCFNFPADAGIEALAGNTAEVTEGSDYLGNFDVVYQDAAEPADRVAVQGSIGDDEGILQLVTLNGAACNLTSQTRFQCDETPARSGLRLAVQVTAGSTPTLNLVKGVALVSETGDVKDILSGNDTLLTQVAIAENTAPAPEEPGDDSQPSNSNPSSSGSGGGSGGGGSLGWFWVLAGLAGIGRLARRQV